MQAEDRAFWGCVLDRSGGVYRPVAREIRVFACTCRKRFAVRGSKRGERPVFSL